MLILHPKLTPRNPHPTGTMSRAEIGDMGTILPSSNSKDSFLPCLKYCPLFNFFKEMNYIKSFLFVLIFTLSTAICTYSSYLLFHLLKNFQLIKIFYLIIHSFFQGWNPPSSFWSKFKMLPPLSESHPNWCT